MYYLTIYLNSDADAWNIFQIKSLKCYNLIDLVLRGVVLSSQVSPGGPIFDKGFHIGHNVRLTSSNLRCVASVELPFIEYRSSLHCLCLRIDSFVVLLRYDRIIVLTLLKLVMRCWVTELGRSNGHRIWLD